ncbi:MAG: substrate-binding domain-containing protein [Candidatus Thiodiazotropha sp. (ex Myrtea sp. 'scaly one' KF741663)]|nr:substrate-binding domain-containing protein [Candidatus Thiodiazotropha sp. (ex Myrtea sp. 'scaly one' KF741663)]
MTRKISGAILLTVLCTFSLSSFGMTLSWAGCGITKKAFMAELATAYEKKSGTKIELEGGGATKGIRKISERQVDFSGSCRFRVEKDGISTSLVQFNPVAWDALAVVVHKSNPVESLSLEQLRDVFMGKVTNWSALGGPDQPLELLIRNGKISGVGHTVRKLLFGDETIDFQASESFKSSGPLEKAIEQNPNAIAVTGISSARKRDFKVINLDGREPSIENIKQGDYLLYRPLYIVTNRESENLRVVKSFINFAHSREGREIIRKNGAVPYLEAVWLNNNLQRQWKEARRTDE